MKILLIDDEPLNSEFLENLLKENGYARIKSVTDSRLAIAACHDFAPDLILLDLMMPALDGFAILEALQRDTSDVLRPIIVLTADANDQTRMRAIRAGAIDFLLKPFDEIDVLLRSRNALEIRRLSLQLELEREQLAV